MDETRIDTLTIEIGASSTKAVSELDKVSESMRRLQTTAKQGISNSFKQSIDALSRIDTSGLTNLASALKSLQDAARISVSSKLGDFISTLSGALKSVQSEDISKLRQIGYALGNLQNVGNIHISKSLPENIELLAVAAGSITPATATALTELGTALNAFSGVKQINLSKDFPDRLRSLMLAADAANPGALAGIAHAVNQMSVIGSIRVPKNLAQFIIDIAQASLLISEQGIANLERITAALSRLSGVDLRGVGSSIRSASRTTAEPNITPEVSGTEDVESNSGGFLGWLKEVSARTKERFKIKFDSKDAEKAAKRISRLSKLLSSLKRVAFYRAIRTALKAIGDAFREGQENAYWYSKTVGEETKYISEAYDNLASSSFKMENQLGAAWATLRTAITPVLLEIVSLITTAANAITQFFAVLSGKGYYLKAIDYAKDWAEATDKGSKSAKEWKNQLLGFDVINRLEEPSSGGGGASALTDYENMFEEAKIEGWAKKIQDFVGEIKLNFEDVFFNWGNLTGEQIAKKVITGLGALVGLSVGFMIGGVPGAVVGTIIGASLGLTFSSFLFDNDGEMSREEVLAMVCTVAGALVGGVIGFKAGGPLGAAIGATVGAGLVLYSKSLRFESNGQSKDSTINSLVTAMFALAGGVIGFSVGGAGGAAVGAAVGVGISMLLRSAVFKQSGINKDYMINSIATALGAAAGGYIGFKYLGIGGTGGVIGAIAGVALALMLSTALFRQGEITESVLFGSLASALTVAAGGKIGFAVTGTAGGAIIGATVGIALSLVLFGAEWAKGTQFGNALEKLGLEKYEYTAPVTITKSSPSGTSGPTAINKFKNAAKSKFNTTNLFGGYASGGFPEDGFFYANHNELVGKFSNGRTAVANNDQIVAGIENGVSNANERIVEAAYAILDAIERRAARGGGDVLAVNGKELARVLYDDMQTVGRERGVALVHNAY